MTRTLHLPPQAAGGFTAIELMSTVAVLAILVALAAPSFADFQRNAEVRNHARALVATLHAARGEAIKTGRAARVVPRSGSGSDWGSGWVAFLDMNGDGQFNPAHDQQIAHQDAPPTYLTVQGAPSLALSGVVGRALSHSSSAPAGGVLTFRRSDTSAAQADRHTWRVIFPPSGNARLCRAHDNPHCTGSTDY